LSQITGECGGIYHLAMSIQAATTGRSRLSTWLPVVVWAGVIFAFSSVPSLGTGLGTWDLVLRKLAHLSEYALLGLLLARAVRRPWAALALAAGYAATDEVHQTFVEGRHGAPLDVAIDTLGALAGIVLWTRWSRRA
jgi:VanZ family protein